MNDRSVFSEPAPLFTSDVLKQRLDLVKHLLQFGRQTVAIIGPARIGKTRILDEIATTLDPGKHLVVSINGSASLSASQLTHRIAEALDIGAMDPEVDQTVPLRLRLEMLEEEQKSCVLIVDDAHELGADARKVLLDLAHTDNEQPELHLLLAAPEDSALVELLQSEAPLSALVHFVEVPTLTHAQGEAFLAHISAATDGSGALGTKIREKILREAEGIPGVLVTLVRQELHGTVETAKTSPLQINSPIVLIGGGIALALILAIGAYVLRFAIQGEKTEPSLTEIELPAPEVIQPVGEAQEPIYLELEDTIAEELLSSPPPTPAKLEPPLPSSAAAPLAEQTLETLEIAAPESAPAGTDNETPPMSPDELEAESVADARPEDGTAIANPSAAESPDLPPEPESLGLSPVTTSTEPAAQTTEPPATGSQIGESQDAPGYSQAYLRTLPDERYVIQLTGLSEQGAAQRFLASQAREIRTRATILTTEFDGKPWYIVVLGDYPDGATARAAIGELSEPLTSLKPWARPLGSLPLK
ncbi:MAG: AAA family ATPase [Pseudomonadota bacterium]